MITLDSSCPVSVYMIIGWISTVSKLIPRSRTPGVGMNPNGDCCMVAFVYLYLASVYTCMVIGWRSEPFANFDLGDDGGYMVAFAQ